MPFVIIVDSTGEIENRHVGYNPGDEKELEKEILHLLADQQPSTDSLQTKLEASVPEKSSEPPAESATE